MVKATGDDTRGTYYTHSQIKLKTTMLKSSLYDYSDAYILEKGTITQGFPNSIKGQGRDGKFYWGNFFIGWWEPEEE